MFNGLKNLFKKKKVKKAVPFKSADVSMQAPPATYVSKRVKAIPYDENNRRMSILFVPVMSSGEIVDYLPVAATDNGDGTASIKIDTELNLSGVEVNNVRIGSSNSQASANKFIKVDNDGAVFITGAEFAAINIESWGGTAQSGADLTPLFQHLNTDLSTRSSEATLAAAKAVLDTIKTNLDTLISQLTHDVLFVTESYSPTGTFAQARPTAGDMNVRHYKSKTVVISNTGANAARVNILASIDDGVNFDIVITNNVAVNAGNVLTVDEVRAFTHIRIEARIPGGATTIETRGYGLGA